MMSAPEEARRESVDDLPEQIGSEQQLELRCLACNSPVTMLVCGRKLPCSSCGFPYPLGDCSDLAEN